MKYYALLLILTMAACVDQSSAGSLKKWAAYSPVSARIEAFDARIDSLLPLAASFVKKQRYNEEFVFIADLSVHSGLPRFAVVNLKTGRILHKGLVAHGCGNSWFAATPAFSNIPNSSCSSLGKYKIGKKYTGRFSKSYQLHGLDKTNNKAFERFVVLHGYDCVPDEPAFPLYICNSRGCPMVSYKFLKTLSSYIDKSKKPILLWIVG